MGAFMGFTEIRRLPLYWWFLHIPVLEIMNIVLGTLARSTDRLFKASLNQQ
jgi:hypothetical protein